MPSTHVVLIAGLAAVAAVVPAVAAAPPEAPEAPAEAPEASAEAPDGPAMVSINFPENVEIKALLDYIAKREGINFIYDEQIGGQRVTIKAPKPVPADSLMTLLEGAMKMKNLTMSPTEVPGMLRVERVTQLTTHSVGPEAPPDKPGASVAVTRVFDLEYASPTRIEEVLRPFFSSQTANLIAVPEHDLAIVTDYGSNMPRLEELIAVVDRPPREALIRFLPVEHLEAADLARQVTQLLAAKAKTRGRTAESVSVLAAERSNQVALVGVREEVEEVEELVRALDVPLGLETRIYTFVVATAEQVDRLTKELIGEGAAKRLYRSATDVDANLLVATATPEIHRRIEDLRDTLDKPLEEDQSPIRFYKLKYAKAADVVSTLQSIEGEMGLDDVVIDGVSVGPRGTGLVIRGPTAREVNRTPGAAALEDRQTDAAGAELREARILADEATNAIIVVAKPSMHSVYEKLIERLDVRRPQVHVEATVVAIDTTDGFSLGIEISDSQPVHNFRGTVLNFTSFGLSQVDRDTGQLSLPLVPTPLDGYNAVLLSDEIANVVLRALETDVRAKVVSRPSVLINDNATGTLVSELEEPFASVNASTTVATTSFAGYSSAGTKIKITPQISEGDHLKLEYEVTLSSFADEGTDILPPARQTNSLMSEATIPDGHTIVVGGLSREDFIEAVDRVPLLGRIPGLEYFFSSRTKTERRITLFVFLRAAILRDDKFELLKTISRDEAARAELESDYPTSEPVEIRG